MAVDYVIAASRLGRRPKRLKGCGGMEESVEAMRERALRDLHHGLMTSSHHRHQLPLDLAAMSPLLSLDHLQQQINLGELQHKLLSLNRAYGGEGGRSLHPLQAPPPDLPRQGHDSGYSSACQGGKGASPKSDTDDSQSASSPGL